MPDVKTEAVALRQPTSSRPWIPTTLLHPVRQGRLKMHVTGSQLERFQHGSYIWDTYLPIRTGIGLHSHAAFRPVLGSIDLDCSRDPSILRFENSVNGSVWTNADRCKHLEQLPSHGLALGRLSMDTNAFSQTLRLT